MMDKFDILHSQKVYCSVDEEVIDKQLHCLDLIYDLNHTKPSKLKERNALIKMIFAEVGDGCYIESPIYANWGMHTYLGKNVYINFNLTLVDDTHIYIGDHVMIGPNVTIATAGHPIDPEVRRKGAQFNIPVVIGNNVWIGANCVILPGVTIGDNVVIGAGSVVTKDIPANVVAVGNPCRQLREVGGHDKNYYYKSYPLDV